MLFWCKLGGVLGGEEELDLEEVGVEGLDIFVEGNQT